MAKNGKKKEQNATIWYLKNFDISQSIVLFLALWPLVSYGANLEGDDIFSLPSMSAPQFIAGNGRVVYVANETMILKYNGIREQWERSIVPPGRIKAVHYSRIRQRLRVQTSVGPYEYIEIADSWDRLDSFPVYHKKGMENEEQELPGYQTPVLGGGFTMQYPWHYSYSSIRDKYMRSAPITKRAVFPGDDLWVLTNGLGIFRGSERRRVLKPFWVSTERSGVQSLYIHEDKLLLGGRSDKDALVFTNLNGTDWDYFVPGREVGLSSGNVRRMVFWNSRYWFATNRGLSSWDPIKKLFSNHSYSQKLNANQVYDVYYSAHRKPNTLYVGTEWGVYYLENTSKGKQPIPREWKSLPWVDGRRNAVFGLSFDESGLWAASRYGLYLWKEGSWVQPPSVQHTRGISVLGVVSRDSQVYWVEKNRLMFGNTQSSEHREVLSRTEFRRLYLQDVENVSYLFAVYQSGVLIYNLESKLYEDVTLSVLPGSQVYDVLYSENFLWVGTDQGVSKVRVEDVLP